MYRFYLFLLLFLRNVNTIVTPIREWILGDAAVTAKADENVKETERAVPVSAAAEGLNVFFCCWRLHGTWFWQRLHKVSTVNCQLVSLTRSQMGSF